MWENKNFASFRSQSTSRSITYPRSYGLSMLRPASNFAQQSGSRLPRWFHSTTTDSQVLKQKPSSSHGLSAKTDRQKFMQEAPEEVTTRIGQDIPPRHGKLLLVEMVRLLRRARPSSSKFHSCFLGCKYLMILKFHSQTKRTWRPAPLTRVALTNLSQCLIP